MYGEQMPPSCDKVVGYFKARLSDYNTAVDQFLAGPFAADRVNGLLDAWSAQIHDAAAEASGLKGAPTLAEWLNAITSLKDNIASARQHRGYPY
jgi:hypothetical protein